MILDRMILDPAQLSFPIVPGGADQVVTLAGAPQDFFAIGGNRTFAPGEPIIIKAARPMYPYSFAWGADVVHYIGLRINTVLPVPAQLLIPAFGPTSSLRMGNMCDDVPLEIYVPAPDLVSTWKLTCLFVQASVSMQNVPAGLAGTGHPSYMLDVLHTLALT